MKSSTTFPNNLFLLVWENTEQASTALTKWHSAKAKKNKLDKALCQTLQYIIGSMRQDVEVIEPINTNELSEFLIANDQHKYSQLLWCWHLFNEITKGDINKAESIKNSIEASLKQHADIENEILLHVFKSIIEDKNGNYEAMLKMTLFVEKQLDKLKEKNAWHYAMQSIATSQKAIAYSNYLKVNEAHKAVDKALAITQQHPLCLYVKYYSLNAKSYTYHHEDKNELAIVNYNKAADIFRNVSSYNSYRYRCYVNIANIYNHTFQQKSQSKKFNKADNIAQQKKYIQLAKKEIDTKATTSENGYLIYTEAKIHLLQNNFAGAVSKATKAFNMFSNLKQYRFLTLSCQFLSYTYRQWAIQENSVTKSLKALHWMEQTQQKVNEQFNHIMQERINGLVLQHELEKKEWNEKLLQQKIDIMNKEIHSIAVNLHEKQMILDELKTYIHSLKKKEMEVAGIINTIVKKIDSVKITDEEKINLQQKINENNQQFYKLLNKKYPSLTHLELEMCGLFKTGLTNKELARIYGQSEKRYEQQRYRIKKKMNLSSDDNLTKHLMNIQ